MTKKPFSVFGKGFFDLYFLEKFVYLRKNSIFEKYFMNFSVNIQNINKMKHSEQVIDFLENYIPERAEIATQQAFWEALNSDNGAVIAQNGDIVKLFSDGTKFILGKLPARVCVVKGQKILHK